MEEASIKIRFTLVRHGYSVSQKRQIIIDQLCAVKYIDNIDEFWLCIRQRHSISWATVRNTIRLLINLGCLIPRDKAADQRGFDVQFTVG